MNVMKKRAWSIVLAAVILLTNTGIGNIVNAEDIISSEPKVHVSTTCTTESQGKQNEVQTVKVTAQNYGDKDAVLRTSLLEEDGTTAELQTEILNLCREKEITDPEKQTTIEETMKEAVTLADGTRTKAHAEWKEETDKNDSEKVTARYLEVLLPAGASADFDLQMMYRMDAAQYEKKVIVQTQAFVEGQDVTEASEREDKTTENMDTLVWNSEVQAEEEAVEESLSVNESGVVFYFAVPLEWTNNQYIIYANGCESNQSNKWTKQEMQDTGKIYSDGRKIYKVNMTKPVYGGYDTLQFLAWSGGIQKDMITAITSWTPVANIESKLWNGSAWEDYTEIDLNDHTYFAGKPMVFRNLSDKNLGNVMACFYEPDESGNKQCVKEIVMEKADNRYYTTIPDVVCSYVKFIDKTGQALGDEFSNFYESDSSCPENFLYDQAEKYCYQYKGSADNSTWGALTGNTTVYYDATLSKLSYEGSNIKVGGKGIPYSGTENIWCYVTGIKENQTIKMNKVGSSDVYSADIPYGYTKIRFAGYEVNDEDTALNGDATDMTDIPKGYREPCFYGDTSDDLLYTVGAKNRGGYWGEKGSIRDAEKGKNSTVVDVPEGTLVRDADKLYIETTLYDYYTDYELNGNNRDNYNPAAVVTSHQIYQPFRQFNMALSDYYRKKGATSPLYWGNFQNFKGSHFDEIAATMDLFDYSNEKNKFFYENNSMWAASGAQLSTGNHATQGLAADRLTEKKNLALKNRNGGSIPAPFFSEEFLRGGNSKETVLGKVYKNVTFPFVKKQMKHGNATVDYWYFNSGSATEANKNLQLRYSDTDGYFLQSTNQIVYGKTAEGQTSVGNYFPFNNANQSANAALLNYGYGQRIDLNFQLPENGKVLDSNGDLADVEFNFSGDDDVWVYIDGELVLDVGGAHDVVSGTINFADKTATVSSVKDSSGSGTTKKKEVSFANNSNITADYFTKEHTLTMFYMERGLWESNMEITFNFPDENEFVVEKQVDDSAVNQELFGGLFDDKSVFPFTIQNQATHYGTKGVQTNAKQPKTYNDTMQNNQLDKTTPVNTFEYVENFRGQSDVAHWKALQNDSSGIHKEKRFGIISPMDGNLFDASETNAFLKFKFYYDYPDTPGLASIYLELEDATGQKTGGYLSGKTYGNSALKAYEWNTIQVDLNKLQGNESFDYSKVKNIKFDYNWERDIYLDDFVFVPSVVATGKTGFVTKQSEIPDYGSAVSGHLEYPTGAQYTLSDKKGKSTIYNLDAEGMFALADGEKASFKDQFRRGSYIAVSENVNSSVFDTSWTLYENGQAVSGMKADGTVVLENPIPSVSGVNGRYIRDGRQEVYQTGTKDGSIIENAGYTQTGWAKNADNTENQNTIVFRSYVDPDNETTAAKLRAVFVNKVNVGSLVIKKTQADGSAELNGTYTFEVQFEQVAGMSLESEKIVREYTAKVGEPIVITGIPVGTDYRIKEISTSDGSTLDDVKIVSGNGTFDSATKIVSGNIQALSEGVSKAEVIFKNTLKPIVNIQLIKKWENIEGTQIPDTIKVQLQRKTKSEKNWTAVDYAQTGQNPPYIELEKDPYTEKWEYLFEKLEKYADYPNNQNPYIYRVVELDGNNQVIEKGGYLNDIFKVTYSDPIDCEKIADNTSEDFTITNTVLGQLTVIKEDGSNQRLEGAEFGLYMDKECKQLVISSDGSQLRDTTDQNGTLVFKGIPVGTKTNPTTYYLKEIATNNGFVLLKEPIEVKFPYEYKAGDIVNGQKVTEDGITYKMTFTIINDKAFDLPASGRKGVMPFLVVGVALAITAGSVLCMRTAENRRHRRRHAR